MFQIDEGEVEVTFDEPQYQKMDAVDHSTFFECRGFDADGNIYAGTAEYCQGELAEITDIEMIHDAVCEKMFRVHP